MCLFRVGSEPVLHVAPDNYLSTFLFRAAYYSKALASSYVGDARHIKHLPPGEPRISSFSPLVSQVHPLIS